MSVICANLCVFVNMIGTEISVFSLTGMDNCCHVFEQEIQEATSFVYCESFLGTGEHILYVHLGHSELV